MGYHQCEWNGLRWSVQHTTWHTLIAFKNINPYWIVHPTLCNVKPSVLPCLSLTLFVPKCGPGTIKVQGIFPRCQVHAHLSKLFSVLRASRSRQISTFHGVARLRVVSSVWQCLPMVHQTFMGTKISGFLTKRLLLFAFYVNFMWYQQFPDLPWTQSNNL